MKLFEEFLDEPRFCSYLPDEVSRLRYKLVREVSDREYEKLIGEGWRHFGYVLFRPECPWCNKCQPIRIPVADFEPSRTQRRVLKANEDTCLEIKVPKPSRENLALYDKFHAQRTEAVGWADHGKASQRSFTQSYVHNPIPVCEWQYRIGGELVGLGYVDELPNSLSAIYFMHNYDYAKRSLGVFNVLKIIERARERGKEFVHLGYYVEGSRSMRYKTSFRPHELITLPLP